MNFGIKIIYENDELLVLNKTSGIPSAPLRADEERTAVGAALDYFPALSQVVGHKPLEFGLLHRLDTGTSGLLVFTKTQGEFDRLRLAWKKREVVKHYRAIAQPKTPSLPHLPACLDWDMAHSARSAKRMIALTNEVRLLRNKPWRGKPWPARTHIIGVQKVDPYLDVTILLETGVMHQIRCHLAAYGWPLVGDTIYKGLPAERLWLHAWRLNIPSRNPTTLSLEAPLPENWPVDLFY